MLTDEQLAVRAKAGDELAFEALARRYRWLVHGSAAKLYAPGLTQDDLEQEALLGLWAAVKVLDESLGEFGAIAVMAVRRRLFSVVKLANGLKHSFLAHATSLDDTGLGDYGDQLYTALADRRGVDPHAALERKQDLATVVRTFTHDLSPAEREAAVLLMNGASYDEIRLRMGLSWKGVDNALQRGRRKVSAALQEAA